MKTTLTTAGSMAFVAMVSGCIADVPSTGSGDLNETALPDDMAAQLEDLGVTLHPAGPELTQRFLEQHGETLWGDEGAVDSGIGVVRQALHQFRVLPSKANYWQFALDYCAPAPTQPVEAFCSNAMYDGLYVGSVEQGHIMQVLASLGPATPTDALVAVGYMENGAFVDMRFATRGFGADLYIRDESSAGFFIYLSGVTRYQGDGSFTGVSLWEILD